MTVESCSDFCKNWGYLYFGLEYFEECWCADEIPEESVDLGNVCDFPCSGDNTQVCGGSNKLSIYHWV
jgi:WSC domain